MSEPTTFSPPFATHVTSTIAPRVWDDALKKHEPQRVEMRCSVCDARHVVDCEQGRPKEHVLTFANVHLHRDALAPVKLVP